MSGSLPIAGLLYGPESHHLDHLAPLCSLLNVPLVVSEEDIRRQAKNYYPNLDTFYWDYAEFSHKLVNQFPVVITTLPRPLLKPVFFLAEQLQGKHLHTIFCPHGNSDKGANIPFMEALENEEGALVYGPKMIDFLIQKNVFKHLKGHVVIGNYRYHYYKLHQEHFDQIAEREVFAHLPSSSRNLLYAPTWEDDEGSSSFFQSCPTLCKNLPDAYNLIVKLHPNLLTQNQFRVEQIMWAFEKKNNIRFVADFPLIYPLLNRVDAYIGDMSSIGYDFLTFNKPMFFLNPQKRNAVTDAGLYLFRCGIEMPISDLSHFYESLSEHLSTDELHFAKVRREVYSYTFGKERPWEKVQKGILELADRLIENDIL